MTDAPSQKNDASLTRSMDRAQVDVMEQPCGPRWHALRSGTFALLLATAATAAIGAITACNDDATDAVAGSPVDASRAEDAAGPDAQAPDGAPMPSADGGCIDDFDAAPVTCSFSERLWPGGPCPQRLGFCGSDGRTYCSAANAKEAGVAVVLNAACDVPCGTKVQPDGGRLVCHALTEYCVVTYSITVDQSSCGDFGQVGCATNRSCACLNDAGLTGVKGCSETNGAIFIDKPGAVAARPAAME